MALANLLIKIGADISELQVNSEKATRTIEKASQKIDSVGSSIKSTLLAAFSVQAVVSFGQELLRMGDDIVRTSDRTGLLTDEVQKLSYIAGQSGNSIDEITGAIGSMQRGLANGDKGAVGAVKSLGLSFDTLRSQSPYEQLQSIATQIAKIPNPATRAQVAMDLFGKSGIALLPTLTSKFKELGDAAPVMSDNTVRALDSAGDAFDKFSLTIKVFAAESYNYLGKVFDKIVATIYKQIGALMESLAGLYTALGKVPGAGKVFPGLADDIKGLTENARWFKDAAKGMEDGIGRTATAAKTAVPPFDAAGEAVKKLTDEQKKAAAAAKAYAEAFRASVDAMKGTTAIKAANESLKQLNAAAREGVPLQNLTRDAQNAVNATMKAAIEVYTAQGKVAPDAIRRVYFATLDLKNAIPIVHEMTDEYRKLGEVMAEVTTGDIPLINQVTAGWPTAIANVRNYLPLVGKAVDATRTWASTIKDDLFTSLQQIPQLVVGAFTGGGGLGGAFKAIGSTLGATLGKSIGAGISALGKFGGPIGEAIGSLAGPLIGKIVDLFGTAGRDAVKEFAASFGGFDALRTKLNDLGAEGEQLWIKLTQGVGRNNPREAQAAIDAITAALDRQKSKNEEVANAAEQASAEQIAATRKAHDAIDALTNEMNGLIQSIANEAPEEVMGVVETETRRRIAAIAEERDLAQRSLDATAQAAAEGAENAARIIEDTLRSHDFRVKIHFDVDDLPGAGSLPGFATGTRGRFLNFGAGTPVMLHGRERVVTEHEDLGVEGAGDVYVYVGNEQLDARTVRVARKDAQKGGLRPRAAAGRSY